MDEDEIQSKIVSTYVIMSVKHDQIHCGGEFNKSYDNSEMSKCYKCGASVLYIYA